MPRLTSHSTLIAWSSSGGLELGDIIIYIITVNKFGIFWYLPRILLPRIALQDSGSFSRDPSNLTLNHGFPIIRLSQPEEFAKTAVLSP
jgi:hypothetical protein